MLKKDLKLLDVFCLAAGAMISSGLFVLPGIAFDLAGPAVILAYALAGIFVIPAMLSQAELASAMPKAGGTYFFVDRSMGPMAGTFTGFLNWISIALKAAFALIGIGAVGAAFVPALGDWAIPIIAIIGCVLFTIVNLVSVKSVGQLQTYLVFGLIGIVLLLVFTSVPKLDSQQYVPFMKTDWQGLLAVAGMVFVSYGGLTKVASVGEEVENPGRNLPLGMFLASGLISVLYVLVVFTTVGTTPAAELAGSLTPIALSAKTSMGKVGMILVDIAALFAFITTANAGILSASRSPMAMSRDGLLPDFISRTNKRFHTPHVAILITSTFIILVIALLSVEDLVKTASTMMILMFILVNVAVIIMRQSNLQSYRPEFRTPFYPWIQIAAIVIYSFLIVEMGLIPLLMTAGFTLLAVLWFVIYVRPRIDRESAFVYLVKSITARAIQRTDLEDELRHISLERSGVELDRFGNLLKTCQILDIKESIAATDLFRLMSETLAPKLDMDSDHLYDLFLKREHESSTVIQPGLAIPHVIVEGQNRFEILLVRCKPGIVFSDLHPPVKTVFALIGSLDERNYHLRALMHIAHLVQAPEFERRWMQARHEEQLRDVALLSRPLVKS